jgi:hypothetical protein
MPKFMTVVALTHDLIRKRSIASVIWDDDAENRVALPVPLSRATWTDAKVADSIVGPEVNALPRAT